MESISCTTVGTPEILTIIISTHLSHQRLDGSQLIIQPLVEFLATFLGREIVVEGILERSLAIQVKEIIVVQCTEEANFCDLILTQATRLLRNKEVVLVDVITESLICPVNTHIILVPIHGGDLSNTIIFLISPQSFVCHQLFQVEHCTDKSSFTLVATYIC